nr:zinc finger, CCHC-type [Tanacetum cinerariifolium]
MVKRLAKDKRMASMNTRLNIEKLDVNIVQKHGGSKQVEFKQLGPCVKTGVHGVHDEKHVWFEVKLQGAQGDREAKVFQVSNDDTVVAQRRLKDKQPEEKTNTDCLGSTQQCMKSGVAKHLGVAGIQQQNGLVDETNVTLFAKVLQGVEFEVEPQEDHTFEVEPHGIVDRVVGSQEVKTQDFIYYHSARDREQHSAWKLFSYREDSNEAAFAVAVVEKIYAHESSTFNNTAACEAEIWATKGLLDEAKENILGMEIVRDQSDNTLRVSQSRFYNGKLVQTLLEGHSILLLEGSLSGNCDVEKNESRYEPRLVAGIATGALVKGGSRYEVSAQVEVAAYRY